MRGILDASRLGNALHPIVLESQARVFVHVADAVCRRSQAGHDAPGLFCRQRQGRISERELRGGDGELRKSATMLGASWVHEVLWPEVADFGGDFAREGRGIEGRDVVDGGRAGDEILPEGVLADTVGSDDAEAGDDDAATTSQRLSLRAVLTSRQSGFPRAPVRLE